MQEDCSLIAEIAVWLLRLQNSATYIYGWSSYRVSGRFRDIGLQFCFAIQINLCNLNAIQKDCSWIAEIALWLWRLQLDCWDCKDSATYIYGWSSYRVSGRLRDIGLQFCFAIQINVCNLTAIQEDCSRIVEIAVGLLRLQRFGNLLQIAVWLWKLHTDCWDWKIRQLTYTVGHPTTCRGGCVSSATRQWD